jgi:hypothetical protein
LKLPQTTTVKIKLNTYFKLNHFSICSLRSRAEADYPRLHNGEAPAQMKGTLKDPSLLQVACRDMVDHRGLRRKGDPPASGAQSLQKVGISTHSPWVLVCTTEIFPKPQAGHSIRPHSDIGSKWENVRW